MVFATLRRGGQRSPKSSHPSSPEQRRWKKDDLGGGLLDRPAESSDDDETQSFAPLNVEELTQSIHSRAASKWGSPPPKKKDRSTRDLLKNVAPSWPNTSLLVLQNSNAPENQNDDDDRSKDPSVRSRNPFSTFTRRNRAIGGGSSTTLGAKEKSLSTTTTTSTGRTVSKEDSQHRKKQPRLPRRRRGKSDDEEKSQSDDASFFEDPWKRKQRSLSEDNTSLDEDPPPLRSSSDAPHSPPAGAPKGGGGGGTQKKNFLALVQGDWASLEPHHEVALMIQSPDGKLRQTVHQRMMMKSGSGSESSSDDSSRHTRDDTGGAWTDDEFLEALEIDDSSDEDDDDAHSVRENDRPLFSPGGRWQDLDTAPPPDSPEVRRQISRMTSGQLRRWDGFRPQVAALVKVALPNEVGQVSMLMKRFAGREAELVHTLQRMSGRTAPSCHKKQSIHHSRGLISCTGPQSPRRVSAIAGRKIDALARIAAANTLNEQTRAVKPEYVVDHPDDQSFFLGGSASQLDASLLDSDGDSDDDDDYENDDEPYEYDPPTTNHRHRRYAKDDDDDDDNESYEEASDYDEEDNYEPEEEEEEEEGYPPSEDDSSASGNRDARPWR